ncbi:hypothetical protein GA0115240_107912 [Streptomyces sp. DvalAA-14]|uniref:hypothetical protein n=1 Tax=unclassified Streptomyces TaxID=2593676 RepID=UPI00081B3EAC|nr:MULTISPECIES: hypothetical protein [unclassified Streptomyces]MYS19409.1 hypothetical protein [Streptomyces sp. SID4948]SCD43761.1 hypothetical protein GA0115240_107912 [Streptomyces sp. DvalAA-14]
MRRHRFEPAALMMGLVLLAIMTGFILDACGVLDLSDPHRSIPAAGSALALAAVTALVTQGVRSVRNRARRRR